MPKNLPQEIIIDGYNLIFAVEELRPLALKDFSKARQGLIELLRRYKAKTRAKVTIVFDGTERGEIAEEISGGIRVLYSRQPESADCLIARLMKKIRPGQAAIVSSDKEIIDLAKAHYLETIRAKAFERILKEKLLLREPTPHTKEEIISEEEVNYWLKRFSEVSEKEATTKFTESIKKSF
ncbi:MAG: NYN domain-containing protein [Candidatus Edwardsbacteria bacterium]